MALARQCDRCGKTFNQYTDEMKRNGVVKVRIRPNGDFAFDYLVDDVKSLCPDCMESFEKWCKEV